MSDRSDYVEITIHKDDIYKTESIIDFEDDDVEYNRDLREITLEEVRYGLYEPLKELAAAGVNFLAYSSAGDEYLAFKSLGYAGEYVEIFVNPDGDAIAVIHDGKVSESELENYRKFREYEDKIEKEWENRK